MAGLAEGGPRVQTACALTWQDTVGPDGRDGIRLLRGGAETGKSRLEPGRSPSQAEGEDAGPGPGGKATAHIPNPGTELAARCTSLLARGWLPPEGKQQGKAGGLRRGGGAPHFALGRGSGNGPRTKRPVSRL